MGMEAGPRADDCQGGEANIAEITSRGESRAESSSSVTPASRMSPVPICSAES